MKPFPKKSWPWVIVLALGLPVVAVGLVIGSIVFGFLLPAFYAVQIDAVRTLARNDASQIANAIRNFRVEYGHYPLIGTKEDASVISDEQLMDVLLAENREMNWRAIIFFEAKPARDDRSGLIGEGVNRGDYVDPWGAPYHIVLDADSDNRVADPLDGDVIETDILAYSAGPDGNPATAGDNVASWK